jgi:aminopeptidase N
MQHLELDLQVDFERERIVGRAGIHVLNKSGTRKLYLDSGNLSIQRVTLGTENRETSFELGEPESYLGQPLVVDIFPDTRLVNVFYETGENATALDWMEFPEKDGGTRAFLFTQGQSILTRSWVPCQDIPSVRITYHARITVPSGMIALMSAENGTSRRPDGVYEFTMQQPIPCYLLALAVGDFEFRAISERCGVFAQPDVVDAAAWEFEDTEAMMNAAEALYGPYRWGRYDILVLPPSFPFGGMENPRLSFVTPVLVAGDRSLVSTIAHELAHSWSGNLVTNATWDDFWINEGFTTYFERRILEALYGKDHADMLAELGLRDLREEIAALGTGHPDTRLHYDLSGRDPDEVLSDVPYEKGYLFLRLIEATVGRGELDAFLRGYFDTFAFQTMTSARFADYLRENLIKGDRGLEAALNIDSWIYTPGLPKNCPDIRSSAFEMVREQAAAWKTGTPPAGLQTTGWTSQQWKQFVHLLPSTMTARQMKELDDHFHFTDKSNAEVLQVWMLHVIANRYEPAYPKLESFLVGIGRIWLIEDLYERLAESPEGLRMAVEIYRKARPGYHPLAVRAIDKVLSWEGG